MSDEVIEELWQIKDAISKENGRDISTLVTYLQGKEQRLLHRNGETKAASDTGNPQSPAESNQADPA